MKKSLITLSLMIAAESESAGFFNQYLRENALKITFTLSEGYLVNDFTS